MASDSAYTIFGELEESNYSRIIIAALRDEPEGLTSTQLHKLFGNHVKNRVLRKELDSLVETGRIRLEKRKTKGAPKKVYLLAKDSEIC
jgi:DNA-binding HxlR family transcriptional regulator